MTRVPRQEAVYELYYLALADRRVSVEMVADPGRDTERTLRLLKQPAVASSAGAHSARAWHLVALAHRALHHELGTFGFSLERADARLRDADAHSEAGSDVERLIACFADRRLAWQIFETLEDLRIDGQLPRRLPGLRPALREATTRALRERPPLEALPPRCAAMELLLQHSLGHTPSRIPAAIAPAAAAFLPLAAALLRPEARVEDTALATVRAYAAIARLPNLGIVGAAEPVDVASLTARSPGWPDAWPEPERAAIEGDAVLEVALPCVSYRDDLQTRAAAAPPPAPRIQQAVYAWHSSEGEPALSARGVEGPPEPLPHEHHDDGTAAETPRADGPLVPGEARAWLYPEWDRYRGALLQRWCRVVEEPPACADGAAVHEMAIAHQLLLARLRRAMLAENPRALATRRRMGDGDDIDFDAAVEALVDLRSGGPGRDHVYQRLDRRRRDAVVGVLVDASSSTGSRVTEAPPLRPLAHRDAAAYRDHPRILDMALLSTVLCLGAAQGVGDASAAWTFSGNGREAVRVQALKTVAEPFGGRILERAAAVRPGHATRLGAAVRHATAKLVGAPHLRKTLLILTDGRPYDSEYGQQYGEDGAGTYALADTAHALEEARRAGVRPVLLAIGAGAAGELAGACAGDVHALDDITALPEHLTALYRQFTAGVRGTRLPATA